MKPESKIDPGAGRISPPNRADDAQFAAEVDVLRHLCDVLMSNEQRGEIVRALGQYRFTQPEHEVLFESISSLLAQRVFSAAALAVHLNNRGFPDIDLDKYFANESRSFSEGLAHARALSQMGSMRSR